ncbi:MAG: EpsG family protein [Lachnospiraceae bacterium]|nr:EpsG family protein [Lachnospiraceae bacterium]
MISPYLIVPIILACCYFVVQSRIYGGGIERFEKCSFCVIFAIITLMLIFRYGQGSDYYGYRFNYFRTMIWKTPQEALLGEYDAENHGERLWLFLLWLMRELRVPYEAFSAIIALISMLFLLRFINIYCREARLLALLCLYPVVILTYLFSSIREGLIISIFLGVLLGWIREKKYIAFAIAVLLLSLIHSVSLVILFCIPALYINRKLLEKLCVAGIVLGYIVCVFDILGKIGELGILPNAVLFYINEGTSPSIMAIWLRIILGITMYAAFCDMGGNANEDVYKFFLMGLTLYFALLSFPIIASRVYDVVRYVDIVLVVAWITKKRGFMSVPVLLFCLLIAYKNIGSIVAEGKYNNIQVYKCPYLNLFDVEYAEQIAKDEFAERYVYNDSGELIYVYGENMD